MIRKKKKEKTEAEYPSPINICLLTLLLFFLIFSGTPFMLNNGVANDN